MSYILEALKRAERERRAGTSSLLDEVPSAAPASAPPAWQRWVVPAVVSALVAALLTYLAVGRGPHAPAATPAAVAATATPPPAPAAPASAKVLAAEPAPTQPTIEDDGRIANLNDLDDKPVPAADSNKDDDDSPAATPTRATNTRDSRRAAAATIVSGTAPDDGGDSRPASSIDNDRGGAGASAAAVASTPAASTQNLREMPDSFRANFPSITVDVHAYSDEPAQRFVLINGKSYHENDTLPQGPRIVGIVPEGIVFDWQGQRVLYPINH